MSSFLQAPSPSAIEAAVSLLADADPRVVGMCRWQVLAWGAAARPALRAAAAGQDARLRVRARRVLCSLERRLWLQAVRRVAHAIGHEPRPGHSALPLELGALVLAELDRAESVVEGEAQAALAELASGLGGTATSAVAAARALQQRLGDACGLQARVPPAHDVAACLLDQVLLRRHGSASAVGIVYLAVARRAGLRASGVLAPDRVLVRVHGARAVLIDPAGRGQVLSKADCVRELRARGFRGASAARLEDASDAQVLGRVADDLRRCYAFREDVEALVVLQHARAALERASR